MRKLTFRAEGLALRMIEAVSGAGERALHNGLNFLHGAAAGPQAVFIGVT